MRRIDEYNKSLGERMFCRMKYIFAISMIFGVMGCYESQSLKKDILKQNLFVKKGISVQRDEIYNYYQVIFDYTTGISRKEMGRKYGEILFEMFGNAIEQGHANYIESQPYYTEYMKRVKNIKTQIPKEYREEIEGLASNFSGGEIDEKDGKLSINEVYFLNLSHGILQKNRCSGFSVYGDRSYNGKTMTAWLLDWAYGTSVPTVFTIKSNNNKIMLIGSLMNISGFAGLNEKGFFYSLLGSQSDEKYPDLNLRKYRSHAMDLRHALVYSHSIQEIADYLLDEKKDYTTRHVVILSDAQKALILENNPTGLRAVREEKSELHAGIKWDIPDAIATVNSYLLEGNVNNHTKNQFYRVQRNTNRWKQYKQQITSKGNKINFEQMKEIATYYYGESPGFFDIYNKRTQQIVIFEPHTMRLEIFFRLNAPKPPKKPKFLKIPIHF